MGAGRSLTMRRRTALYRLYDASGDLLYVGITFHPPRRWTQHKAKQGWWPEVNRKDIQWFDTRIAASRAELDAIAAEKPRYNIASTTDPDAAPRLDPPVRSAPKPAHAMLESRLKKAAQSYARALRRRNAARRALGLAILGAAAEGRGTSEITKLIDHEYTEAHVSRMVNGKA